MKPSANIHVNDPDGVEVQRVRGTVTDFYAIQWPDASVSVSSREDILEPGASSQSYKASRIRVQAFLETGQLHALREQIDAALAAQPEKAQAA